MRPDVSLTPRPSSSGRSSISPLGESFYNIPRNDRALWCPRSIVRGRSKLDRPTLRLSARQVQMELAPPRSVDRSMLLEEEGQQQQQQQRH
jgi:hypothetical protein